MIKEIIAAIGFSPEDGRDNVFYKVYPNWTNYIIRVNFNTEKIEYREDSISENEGIVWGDATTSNFENSENFVVLECVNRLLEKGYAPKVIALEKKYPLGRNLKGKLDIVVADNNGKSFLMIECKTWGEEYKKEKRKMLKNGAQLFSYFANDRTVQYLCLYTSQYSDGAIEYKNDIVPVETDWIELANVKEIHDHWNKNFKDNGIFEEWAAAYGIEIKALVRGRLQPLTKDDSGRIFNQFAEILRHNVVSDKPNAFNKILNLFICKIIDEDKNEDEQVDFQWLEDDTDESLQVRLNDLYKKGMHRFLEIEVTDYSDEEITEQLANISDKAALYTIKNMLTKLRLQKNPEFAFIEVYNDQSFKINAHIVREVVELLQPYQFRYGHKQQFLGDFFELLLNTSIKQEAGQFFTPVPICRYIVYSLPIKEFILNKLKAGEPHILPAVIDFACGTGHFLTEYMDRVQSIIEEIDIKTAKPSVRKKLSAWRDYDKYDWAKEYVYGIDADYRLVKSAKVSSFLNGDGEANIIRANGLDSFSLSREYKGRLKEVAKDNPQDNGQFDILIANPPYSVSAFKSTVKYGEQSFELFNRLTDNSSEIECLFVERMKQLLKVGGYAGIILPSSILSNAGTYTAAREIILKYFKIKGITELGSNTFMATGTNTVILFLERRHNNDHKQIANAINSFFERPKETTVLGIEKAFSKYVSKVFDGISLEDYVSFVNRKANDIFKSREIWTEYHNWFYALPEIVKLQTQRQFTEKTISEQETELKKLFYDKVLEIEKEKILYFLLTYMQETVIIKVGEKQAEKEFLGYEFSNRRGHEGIKMLSRGTRLYDEENVLNPLKASSYNYAAFLTNSTVVDESMEDNISIMSCVDLINFSSIQFEKTISLTPNMKNYALIWNGLNKFPLERLGNCSIMLQRGKSVTYGTANTQVIKSGQARGYTEFDFTQKYYVDDSFTADERNLQRGDLLINSTGVGTAGRVTLFDLEGDYVADSHITILRLNQQKVLPKYALYTLATIGFKNIEKMATGQSGQIELALSTVAEIKIPIPPLEIQHKIVDEIETIEKEAAAIKHKISHNSSKIETLLSELKLRAVKRVRLSDKSKFDLSIGKRVLKTELVSDGAIPVFSANVLQPFGTIDKLLITDFSVPSILWGIDGDWMVNYIPENTPFYPTNHCGVLRVKDNDILPRYLSKALESAGSEIKFSRSYRASIERIKNLSIPVPPVDEQENVIVQIKPLEDAISKLYVDLEEVETKRKTILSKYL